MTTLIVCGVPLTIDNYKAKTLYRIKYGFTELSQVVNMTHQLEVVLDRYDDKTYDGGILEGFFPILQKFMKNMKRIKLIDYNLPDRIVFTTFRGSANPEPGVEVWVDEIGMMRIMGMGNQ